MFARTERLLLRPGWAEDAPSLFRAFADEMVIRNLASAPWPYDISHAEAFLSSERQAREPSLLVFRRTEASPELIGTVGFGRRPSGEIEFGYWIARAHWGQGYATEAGKAAIAMARDSLRLRKLSAGHFLDNPASGRVLEKLGFRPTGRVIPRYSAGRCETAPSRQFRLVLNGQEEDVKAADCDAMAA